MSSESIINEKSLKNYESWLSKNYKSTDLDIPKNDILELFTNYSSNIFSKVFIKTMLTENGNFINEFIFCVKKWCLMYLGCIHSINYYKEKCSPSLFENFFISMHDQFDRYANENNIKQVSRSLYKFFLDKRYQYTPYKLFYHILNESLVHKNLVKENVYYFFDNTQGSGNLEELFRSNIVIKRFETDDETKLQPILPQYNFIYSSNIYAKLVEKGVLKSFFDSHHTKESKELLTQNDINYSNTEVIIKTEQQALEKAVYILKHRHSEINSLFTHKKDESDDVNNTKILYRIENIKDWDIHISQDINRRFVMYNNLTFENESFIDKFIEFCNSKPRMYYFSVMVYMYYITLKKSTDSALSFNELINKYFLSH